ncbi:hypothetical protein BS50DRAFT_618095 [Corynespora cassiicola Philippines]|uniref:Mid2 domain-containing protein n=1 Tax=Corynespora cassiicola Philippines TaxID=1448308 RepID=A0A2T2NZU9_CORCC|nr:hypothetical protein BS50DRAFT_618095 [Corynespora cassiicola Philippines]
MIAPPTHDRRVLLSTIFAFSCLASAASNSCYYPSGKENRGRPCFPDADVSVCCGPTFVCLSNGLCSPGPDTRRAYAYKYYRSGCTDPTWSSSSCPQFCAGPGHDLDAGEGLQSCGNNKFCCRENYDCCTNSTNIFDLSVGNIVTTIPRPVSATATSSPATSTGRSQNSNTSLAIGLGVGLGVATLLIIILATLLILRRRKNKRPHTESSQILDSSLHPRVQSPVRNSRFDSKEEFNVAPVSYVPELEDPRKPRIPKEPQELEFVPLHEIGRPVSPPQTDSKQKEESHHANASEYHGRYFKEDGTYRHEVPG